MAEGEAGSEAQAFEEHSAPETECCEDQDAAETIEEASVKQGECRRREHLEGDDEESGNSVRIKLEDPTQDVQEKKKYEEGAGSGNFAVVFDEGRHGGNCMLRRARRV